MIDLSTHFWVVCYTGNSKCCSYGFHFDMMRAWIYFKELLSSEKYSRIELNRGSKVLIAKERKWSDWKTEMLGNKHYADVIANKNPAERDRCGSSSQYIKLHITENQFYDFMFSLVDIVFFPGKIPTNGDISRVKKLVDILQEAKKQNDKLKMVAE